MSRRKKLCLPVTQPVTQFGDAFTHQHGDDAQDDEQDAGTADHQYRDNVFEDWQAKRLERNKSQKISNIV